MTRLAAQSVGAHSICARGGGKTPPCKAAEKGCGYPSLYRCRQQGFPLIGQCALHNVVQQRLQCCADARPGGDADVHQIRAVDGQLAHGVAAGLGQLVHAALKGCYIGAAGGNLGCIGVGVKVGVFQRTETAQKDRPAAVQQL